MTLAAALCAVELLLPSLGHPLAAAGWTAVVPAVVCAGLLLAASLHGAEWLLISVTRLRVRLGLARRRQLRVHVAWVEPSPVAEPLRTGWSDRGPPVAALATL